MLNRRTKRRYLSLMHGGQAIDAVDSIVKRCDELFGSIATQKAAIRMMRSDGNITQIKCSLEQLNSVLVSIALTDPPVLTLGMSGSMKRLLRRLA